MNIEIFLVGRTIPELTAVINAVAKEFRAKLDLAVVDLPMTRSYVKSRHQFDAEKLLADLVSFAPTMGDKAVYLIRDDMYAGELSFVFGLAGDNACIVSTARLDPRYYGETDMEKARSLFKERLIKEVLHEIGHTIGLEHCQHKTCLMVFSRSVDDVDYKDMKFCSKCNKLKNQLIK